MIETIYVIGAGASVEYKFPLGNELKDMIKEKLAFRFEGNDMTSNIIPSSGDKKLYSRLTSIFDNRYTRTDLDSQCKKIENGMTTAFSVDEYIHRMRDDELITQICKIAIIRCILESEADSNLNGSIKASGNLDFSDTNSWLHKLVKILFEHATFEEVKYRANKIYFVIFNYDRCVEFFLYHAVRTAYPITDNQASEFVQNLHIFHPYGTVGGYILSCGGGSPLDFGSDPDYSSDIKHIESIKTFTESMESDELSKFHNLGYTANKVIFLGFSYMDQNMKIFENLDIRNPEVYGTVLRDSKINIQNHSSLISKYLKSHLQYLEDLDCKKLFDDFSTVLRYKFK